MDFLFKLFLLSLASIKLYLIVTHNKKILLEKSLILDKDSSL